MGTWIRLWQNSRTKPTSGLWVGGLSGTGRRQRGARVSLRFGMLGDPRRLGLFLKMVSSAPRAARLGPVPPSGGRAGPGGPAGVKRRRGGRGAPPPLAAPGAPQPVASALDFGGDWRRAGGERMWQVPARAAAAGRPRAPVPARLAPPAAARTRAPPPPAARAQSARREHDFCLQAGFPPGHDGRGPPASSRQNVSAAPGGRVAAVPAHPAEEGAALLRPGSRAAAPDRPPPWAFGAGAGRGRRDSVLPCCAQRCGDRAGTGERGVGSGREPENGDRGPASGARTPGEDRRAGCGVPGVWAWGLASGNRRAGRGAPGVGCARARSCHLKYGADGALVAHLKIPSYQITRSSDLPFVKIPFLW